MRKIDKLGIMPYNGSYIIIYDEGLIDNRELSEWMMYNYYFFIQNIENKFNGKKIKIEGHLTFKFSIEDIEQAIEWIKSILIMNQLTNKLQNNINI